MSRFIICKASAGSGKTYTLVRQFIETAISSPSQLEHRFEHILAITFTNKAANGMKERILSQLYALSSGSAQSLCNEIAEHLSIDTDEVRRRCAVVQSAILHHYSELSVCTIDSFVHRLVRTFAHDLRLPMNFDVMIDNQQIIQATVDELLANAGADDQKALTKVLCAYTVSRMDSGKSYRLDDQIAELAKEIFKEGTPQYMEELEKVPLDEYITIERWLRKENSRVEGQLTAAAKKLMDAIKQEGLTPDDFPYKRSGSLSFFIRLADEDFSTINDSHSRADDAYNKQQLWAKNTPAGTRDRMERVLSSFMKAYETVSETLKKELVAYNSRLLMLRNLYGLALLGRLSQIKNTYYKENEKVHISEFNKRIAEEVMNEPAPFIYERIGSRYYNYMIDEFQDTSKLQWLNFLPLMDEAMTHQFSDDTAIPGTQSLVVGDGKQAIYRFRQGDVRQFLMLPQVDSKLHGLSLASNSEVVQLKKNFRTLRNIVEFNNRFFETTIRNHFADNQELMQLYDTGLVQDAVKDGGYVQVSFSQRNDIYQSILDTVRHQVDDRGYSYGDIMILARDKETLATISDHFIANSGDHPVPMVSSESFLLSRSNEVLFLHSMLKYIFNPKDRLSALQAVKLYSLCKPDTSELEWQLRDKNFNLTEVMSEHLDIELLRTLPVYDLCETLIRLFNLNGSGNRFLMTFMNVAHNYVQNGGIGLGNFLKYLDERMDKLSSSTASDLDAVQFMTIHKAKGLESKIVIYAMPNKRTPNSKIWVRMEQETVNGEQRAESQLPVAYVDLCKESTIFDNAFDEERRLVEMDRINILYVAMTRPEEKLFVFCEDAKSSDNTTNNIALLREFVDNDSKIEQGPDTGTPDMCTYHIGEDMAKEKSDSKKPSPDTIHISSILYPPWESRVSIAQQSEAFLSPLDEDNRRYGILIHDLLSRIITFSDTETAIDKCCKEYDLPESIHDDIRNRITAMMQRDDIKHFFDGSCRVKCEASISVNGKVKRPDRIVFAENATFVIDFKTGAYNEHTHSQYQHQVAEYAEALSAMGYPNVKPVIVYV